jgi:hypothetical protein
MIERATFKIGDIVTHVDDNPPWRYQIESLQVLAVSGRDINYVVARRLIGSNRPFSHFYMNVVNIVLDEDFDSTLYALSMIGESY